MRCFGPLTPLSLRSNTSRRRVHLHKLTPCRSKLIQSAPPCRRRTEIERAQIVLKRFQPGLPRSTGSVSPVFGRTSHAGPESSRMVRLTTQVLESAEAADDDLLQTTAADSQRPAKPELFQCRILKRGSAVSVGYAMLCLVSTIPLPFCRFRFAVPFCRSVVPL